MNSLIRRGVLGVVLVLGLTPGAFADYGRTQGVFGVKGSASTYTLPIWMPPGPNGLQPSIALTYNSQAGNGTAGVGWEISGLSAITRCARTIHQDTTPAAVDMTANDRFCINGNRLRLVSGSYGASGSVYHTELADFSRITALTTSGGALYFLVEAKSGLKYEYGNDGNSRATSTLGTHAWWVNKVYDRNGTELRPDSEIRPMSGYCEWVIAKDYYDGPMSGVGFRLHDRRNVFFIVVGWDAEQWRRVFAVAPIREQLVTQLCSMLERWEQRIHPFWLPGPVTDRPEIATAWRAAQSDALQSSAWTLVESRDLLESSEERALSSQRRALVSSFVEKNEIKDLVGESILQSFVEGMGGDS